MSADIKFNLSKMPIDKLLELSKAINNTNFEELTIKTEFLTRYEYVDAFYEDFLKSYVSIEAAKKAGFDKEEHLSIYNEYEGKIYSIKSVYNTFYKQIPQQNVKSDTKPEVVSSHSRFHIPNIQIPSFSGKITEYINFRNIFKSLIHDDHTIKPIQKMHYLLSCLKDDALQLIKHLVLSDENYFVAYDILEKRYYNTRIIAEKHLDSLLLVQLNGRTSLRIFLDIINENILALKAMKFNVDEWSFILLHLTLKKLPVDLRNSFELKYTTDDKLPTFSQLIEFLEAQCKANQACNYQYNERKQNTFSKHQVAIISKTPIKCFCCKGDHYIFACSTFRNMEVSERNKLIKTSGLCWNCLHPHRVQQCSSNKRCKVCGGKHNSLLHVERVPASGKDTPSHIGQVTATGSETSTFSNGTCLQASLQPTVEVGKVVLGTTMLHIKDEHGNFHEIRGLVDPGSTCSLITEACVQRLKLKRSRAAVSITGVGGEDSHYPNSHIRCTIKPIQGQEPQLDIITCSMKRITKDLPLQNISSEVYKKFSSLNLADKRFHISRPIDILLGGDVFNEIMDGGKITFDSTLPSAYSTIFGWIIIGKIPDTSSTKNNQLVTHTVTLDNLIQSFWELEQVPETTQVTPEDEKCEKHFTDTISRTKEGRFIARLPFKEIPPTLGESKSLALRRFYSLENRLEKDSTLKVEYSNVMNDYMKLHHMEKAKISDIKYFLPHHCVVKHSSTTTRVRIVFDASMRTTNGLSLNDVIMSGPKLQKNISDVLVRFRLHSVAFICDARMMFRQINLHQEDRNYHGIFWRDSPDKPLEVFRLTTVTFGVTSSPYLAMRCLAELSKIGQFSHPNASRIIQNEIYVDDFVCGADSVQQALEFKSELIDLLAQAGFELRKWASSSKEFLASIPSECCEEIQSFDSKCNMGIKVLGIQWIPSGDYFRYNVNIQNTTITKRAILSNIARLYDPCGWLTPVTFLAKSILQEIWLLKLGWDDIISNHISDKWNQFISQLHEIQNIQINRCVVSLDKSIDYQLHGFSDASEKGYAVALYLRSEDQLGNIDVHLLMGKSKLAPVKQKISIPRMELCGVHLLSKSLKYISSNLDSIQISSVFGWSDSKVALSWIRTPLHRLKSFEANRVSQIHANCDDNIIWRYIPSSANPSDCASRGVLPTQLVHHKLWWKPPILFKSQSDWPEENLKSKDSVENGFTEVGLTHTVENNSSWDILERYSSFSKLVRVTAYCMRFIHNIRNKNNKQLGYITVIEWNNALTSLIKNVQSVEFSKDIKLIKRDMSHRTTINKMRPFIDANGIIRIDGRLHKSSLHYEAKHPVILPKSHSLTMLIITYYHKLYLHAGPSITLSNIRQKYWIISGRSIARKIIHRCITCFRTRPRNVEPLMATLPQVRVQQARVFSKTGCDFAGPFYIKSSTLRNAKIQKVYLCLFICMVTKTVHIEIVSDLSTSAFLAAFDRFVSRRGLCSDFYSDGGMNFVGVKNHLKEVHTFLQSNSTMENVSKYLTERQITFHRNPGTAAHFGGLWERTIASIKSHMKKTVGETKLTFEELYTLATKVEAVLNSRPICEISDNSEDFDVLTPGHFLIGQPLLSLPEKCVENTNINSLGRWELIKKFSQQIWKRWHIEYLHTLHQRSKWTTDRVNVKKNELVLIKDDNLPPLQWKMARIVKLHPGNDGRVRVVELRTSKGYMTRPVVKICPLPLE